MFLTSELVYIIPKPNETNKIKENTQLEYNQKYGYNYYTKLTLNVMLNFLIK